MSVMTGPLAAARHRQHSITHPATGANIRFGIFGTSPAFCRPMLMMDTMSSTSRPARPGRSHRRSVGPTPDGSSSTSRIAANARRGKNATAISPIALETVRRIDVLFDIERNINGLAVDERLRIRKETSTPLLVEMEVWLREQRSRLPRSASVAEPIDYMLKRWDRFVRFIDDGRICLSNNAAERALRGFALGRKSWLFAGSDRGADRAATMATLIMTAKLNDVDPQAWLADVLARIAGIPQGRLAELLHWEWECAAPNPARAARYCYAGSKRQEV
jgi:hypothetical protein